MTAVEVRIEQEELDAIKRSVLTSSRRLLVDSLDPANHLSYLRSKFVMTERDAEEINAPASRSARVEVFLDKLSLKGSEAYDEFQNSLCRDRTQLFILTSMTKTLELLKHKVREFKGMGYTHTTHIASFLLLFYQITYRYAASWTEKIQGVLCTVAISLHPHSHNTPCSPTTAGTAATDARDAESPAKHSATSIAHFLHTDAVSSAPDSKARLLLTTSFPTSLPPAEANSRCWAQRGWPATAPGDTVSTNTCPAGSKTGLLPTETVGNESQAKPRPSIAA
jgi:hypothetical protein